MGVIDIELLTIISEKQGREGMWRGYTGPNFICDILFASNLLKKLIVELGGVSTGILKLFFLNIDMCAYFTIKRLNEIMYLKVLVEK